MSGTLKVGGKTLATHDTAANEISFHPDAMATTAQVQGVQTTSTVSIGSASLTINSFVSGSSVSNGDYVVGEGITPGTTVLSGGGTTSITLSANAGATLSTDPVSFYNATKALSAGTVAGGLCRAWCNINGSTDTFRSAFNISSISLNGNIITVNFTADLPDTNYVFVGTSSDSTFLTEYNATARGVGSISFISRSYTNASSKPNFINIAIFR